MEKTITLKTVKKVIGLEETSSTQGLARSLAATETDGTLILACHQTQAVGQKGNPFYAGEGGVYFTLILDPQTKISSSKLTLAMSNAISDVISNVLGIKTKLSKSGEILCYDKSARSWKKCAGVLAERSEYGTWLLGAGIYLNNRLPIGLRTTCISLKSILGGETSKELFLDEVLNNFWKEYAFL
ncbi:MAG: hypothetical protein J6Y17_02185 [Elusimicrobiaceae bacterium]|nr:hypothetical protein [Elusimicrobiaceae bacterium]